jgi:hypothetical protein
MTYILYNIKKPLRTIGCPSNSNPLNFYTTDGKMSGRQEFIASICRKRRRESNAEAHYSLPFPLLSSNETTRRIIAMLIAAQLSTFVWIMHGGPFLPFCWWCMI